jgi:sulfite reductase (NADPH) flavoprotein alpha-component
MSDQNFIPQLPDNAPFTPEQRAYLNGFFAGMFSRVPDSQLSTPNSQPASQPLTPLSILFGSQTGTAEGLAKRIAKEAGKRGFASTTHDLAKYPVAQLASEERVLIVTSTYGDGEPPDNAKAFWDFLNSSAAPKLPQLRFSVCAIGDSNYPKFCGFGKELDARLEALGANRMHPRADCDLEYEEPFAKWLNEALSAMATGAPASSMAPNAGVQALACSEDPLKRELQLAEPVRGAPKFSRANPFPAALVTNRKLNAPGSEKDTRHFEIDLNGSALNYDAGDALGVIPENCQELVTDLLSALKCSGDEAVSGRDGTEVSLRDALARHYEVTKISQPFLKAMAERTSDELLTKLTMPGVNGELTKFLWGREIIDLLLAHPAVKFSSAEFVALLKKLQPRLYSISSSPKAHPGQVHLTVNVVRYESLARKRKGVCSSFLADRVTPSAPVPVFVHANKNFRPPTNGETPMIMVGPGTGIAPFRAFIEDRQATGAKGKNWLFFGDQRAATDFMYRDELETLKRDGVLTRLDTAFSRDQAEKIYVQDRMREQGRELFAWLEAGAHFYVCGDANRMAKDVDAALHEIVQTAGGRTKEQAAEYIAGLKSQKRYQRDVY